MKAYKKILVLPILLLLCAEVSAQFQNKFTIDVGVSPLIPNQAPLRDDRLPYLFSNFEYGYGTYTNLLYNLNKKISIGGAVSLSTFRSWKDPRTNGSSDKSFFNIYSLDPNIKYKILSNKISPFVMAGAGISIYHAKRAQTKLLLKDFFLVDFENEDVNYVSIDNVLIREPGYALSARASLNVLGAVGVDIKISENVGITLMACYNMSFTAGNFDLDQKIRYLSFPVGVNLSIGKSKTL